MRTTTAIAVALGLAGGAWGLAVAADAGVAAVLPAAAALAGALMALRSTAVAFVTLLLAGSGGVMAAGTPWIGPGLLASAASLVLLAALPDPFAAERARERGEVPEAPGA
jgi:hypothetical protein